MSAGARRLAVLADQVGSPSRSFTVAIWPSGGSEQLVAEVLRPLCANIGVEVLVLPPAAGLLFPQFLPERVAGAAARLSDEERQGAEEEVKRVCGRSHAWLGWPQSSWPRVEALLGGWPAQLEWIQTLSAGADALLEAVPGRVAVARAEGKFDASVAEWVLAWIFMHAKQALGFLAAQREHSWRPQFQHIRAVAGSTVLVVGLGSIGRRVAALCAAVGMHVLATRRSVREVEEVALTSGDDRGHVAGVTPTATVHPMGDLHGLLPRADVVVLSLPLTAETRGAFGVRELALLRPGAQLINVSRGEAVDWPAARAALRARRLAAFYADVTSPEPLPEGDADWALPGLVVTPHNSWMPHPDPRDDACRFFGNLQRWLRGERLKGLVERGRSY